MDSAEGQVALLAMAAFCLSCGLAAGACACGGEVSLPPLQSHENEDQPAVATAPQANKQVAKAKKKKKKKKQQQGKGKRKSHGSDWPEDWTSEALAAGEEGGSLLRGQVTISRSNPHQAYVAVRGRAQDILLDSKRDRNRALQGDTVLVELIEPEQCKPRVGRNRRRTPSRPLGVVRHVIADAESSPIWLAGGFASSSYGSPSCLEQCLEFFKP